MIMRDEEQHLLKRRLFKAEDLIKHAIYWPQLSPSQQPHALSEHVSGKWWAFSEKCRGTHSR